MLMYLQNAAQGVAGRRHSDTTIKNGQMFVRVDEAPEAGYDVNAYVMSHVNYPAASEWAGKVIVKFVLNEDGHISDAVMVRGADSALDRAVIKAVSGMPAWAKPAVRDGKKVKVPFVMPFIIHLQ